MYIYIYICTYIYIYVYVYSAVRVLRCVNSLSPEASVDKIQESSPATWRRFSDLLCDPAIGTHRRNRKPHPQKLTYFINLAELVNDISVTL